MTKEDVFSPGSKEYGHRMRALEQILLDEYRGIGGKNPSISFIPNFDVAFNTYPQWLATVEVDPIHEDHDFPTQTLCGFGTTPAEAIEKVRKSFSEAVATRREFQPTKETPAMMSKEFYLDVMKRYESVSDKIQKMRVTCEKGFSPEVGPYISIGFVQGRPILTKATDRYPRGQESNQYLAIFGEKEVLVLDIADTKMDWASQKLTELLREEMTPREGEMLG